jgi:hypothetical protein
MDLIGSITGPEGAGVAKWISGQRDEAKRRILQATPAGRLGMTGPGNVHHPLRFCLPGSIHYHGARTYDHLWHVSGMASRTRPSAAACDRMRRISPRPRTRWSGAISGGGGRCWVGANYAEPTVDDTAHLQQPGDLGVPVMTCDFSWWQVLGSNQRRLSRRFYRPRTIRA